MFLQDVGALRVNYVHRADDNFHRVARLLLRPALQIHSRQGQAGGESRVNLHFCVLIFNYEECDAAALHKHSTNELPTTTGFF